MECFWEGYRRLQGLVWPGRSRDTNRGGMMVATHSSATLWCSLHFRFMDSTWPFCWLLGQGQPAFLETASFSLLHLNSFSSESLCSRSFPHCTDRSYLREGEWFLHLVPEGGVPPDGSGVAMGAAQSQGWAGNIACSHHRKQEARSWRPGPQQARP